MNLAKSYQILATTASETAQKSTVHTAADHFYQLHADHDHVVLIWLPKQAKKRWTKLYPDTANIVQLLSDKNFALDCYISINAFKNWRRIAQLISLRANYVDIDFALSPVINPENPDLSTAIDIDYILQCVTAAGLPTPTMIIHSGRGVHLYWQYDAVPKSALGVWQAVQNHLVQALKKQGLPVDPMVTDCTRVLRLAGSINSKNGKVVRGNVLTPWKWDFHSFCNEVLGDRLTKSDATKAAKALEQDQRRDAQVRDFRAAQIRKGLEPTSAPKSSHGSIYVRWQKVYQDLVFIGEQLGAIKEGHRDIYLFLYAVSLSWFAGEEALEAEVVAVAKKLMPEYKLCDIKSAVQPNLKRLQDAMAEKKVIWNGEEVDSRYRYTREKLFTLLEGVITPSMYPHLRAIIPEAVRAQRKAERDSARWTDSNTKAGVRASNIEKAALARGMRESGDSFRTIATALDVSVGVVHKWCSST